MGKIERIHRILKSEYGNPRELKYKPLETLILTILSQNTSDLNRDRAYTQLRKKYRAWREVLNAPTKNIAKEIKQGGLSKSKAAYIKGALNRVKKDNGKLSLDYLKKMKPLEAKDYLISMNGIGPKTAAVVMCFSLGMPSFPVDTHVHRVSKRIGLITSKTSREKAHEIFEKRVNPEIMYSLHILLIEHGRKRCKAQKPRCPECPLLNLCEYKNKTT